jgi:hypothetical protein
MRGTIGVANALVQRLDETRIAHAMGNGQGLTII